ncbi:MAG: NAD(P)/FAD-dependent oxidoreductase [Actinomycetales bacterium]
METRPHRIVIVGGGYVGMYTALRLQQKLRLSGPDAEATVTVIDPRAYMTYQPFLPEAAAGNLEPRHVVVPLRRVLRHCRVLTGHVTAMDVTAKRVTVENEAQEVEHLDYDTLVYAAGSVARTLPIPGLAERGIGFKEIEEAIGLRNQVLEQLEKADGALEPERRRCALTFVFVGGGYAGVEALAELEDMARYAMRFYPRLSPDEMRFVLVEASDRILPEVGEDMGEYTVRELRRRGIEVRLSTRLESCVDGHVVLSDGERFDSDVIVWTAGVKPNPLTMASTLPVDDRGRVRCLATLQVEGLDGVWSAGDVAAVPDLTSDKPGAVCGPSAQHAVRQAKQLGDNIAAVLHGQSPVQYRHKYAGSVASLGLHKGVAQVYGVKLRGWPAWFMHRSYHVSRVPTFNRKARVIADWTLALFFRREVVALGSLQHPRQAFRQVAAESAQAAQQRAGS